MPIVPNPQGWGTPENNIGHFSVVPALPLWGLISDRDLHLLLTSNMAGGEPVLTYPFAHWGQLTLFVVPLAHFGLVGPVGAIFNFCVCNPKDPTTHNKR